MWVLAGDHSVTCPDTIHVPPSVPPSGVMSLIPAVSGNPGQPRPNCWAPRTSYQRKGHQAEIENSSGTKFSQKVQFYNYVHLYIHIYIHTHAQMHTPPPPLPNYMSFPIYKLYGKLYLQN